MAKTKTCAVCEKSKPVDQFPADGRTKDQLSGTCIGCKSYADGALQTVDLDGVELMSEGGPYFGKGSAEGGDFFTREQLEAIAAANRDLAAELLPPNKLGHSKEQILLAQSGLGPKEEGEYPAAGWLDGTTFDVIERDGKAKLVANVKKVPKKLAELFQVGAFRTRSVELAKVTAQDGSGIVYDQAVVGLAWLGAKRPAIRTLDDWIGFAYADEDGRVEGAEALLDTDDIPEEVDRTVDFAAGDVVWSPADGLEHRRNLVQAALNPSPPGGDQADPRYWVQDVSADAALVQEWASSKSWVVPVSFDAGRATLAAPDEWTPAETAWVEAAPTDYQEFLASRNRIVPKADTTTMKLEAFSDDQIKTFAAGFDLDVENVDADELREQVAAKFDEVAPEREQTPTPKPEPTEPTPTEPTPTPTPSADGSVSLTSEELAKLRMQAERGDAAYEAARVEKRDALIESHVKRGALDPAKVDDWKGFYDEHPEMATKTLSDLPVNNDLLAVFGSDDDGEDGEAGGTSYEADFEARFGEKAVV